jgi:uncharacterized protein YggU (UPF0235/DUF167 family)
VLVTLQVVPKARRSESSGSYNDGQNIALKLRLHALPMEGKVNEAPVKWLAMPLDISRSAIAVLRVKTSRRKQVLVAQAVVEKADWGPGALHHTMTPSNE